MAKPSSLCLWQGCIENIEQLGIQGCPITRLDDISLWSNNSKHSLTRLSASYTLELRAQRVVDPTRIPVWTVFGGALRVTSGSNATKSFFDALAAGDTSYNQLDGEPPEKQNPNRDNDKSALVLSKGLLASVEATARKSTSAVSHRLPQFFIFFIESVQGRWTVSGLPLSTDQGVLSVLNVKREVAREPIFLRVDASVETKDAETDAQAKADADAAASAAALAQDTESRNKLRIKHMVMSALRMHNLSRANCGDFDLVAQLTVKSACLAHKRDMCMPNLDLAKVEDTVEKLLAIMLHTESTGL